MLVNIVDAHIVFDLCITPYPLLLSKLYLYINKYILFDMIFSNILENSGNIAIGLIIYI